MAKLTKVTSPKGEAVYPHLRKPEEYQGKEIGYTIQMRFNKEDTEKLEAYLVRELEAAKKSSEFSGKKWMKEPHMGIKLDKNDDTMFKFKTNTTIKTRTGEIIQKTVPIFDAKGNVVKGDIGNGSVCRVRFAVSPYHVSAVNNGLTLYLEAVQVIELVEAGGGNAKAFGFEEEDGYVAAEDHSMDEFNPEDTANEEF